jgi:hypothetical protein
MNCPALLLIEAGGQQIWGQATQISRYVLRVDGKGDITPKASTIALRPTVQRTLRRKRAFYKRQIDRLPIIRRT